MLLDNYQTEDFFDEMFEADGKVRPHYEAVAEVLNDVSVDEFRNKQTAVDASFMRHGVTFTVYSDDQGTEKIFPFDCAPRVISAEE